MKLNKQQKACCVSSIEIGMQIDRTSTQVERALRQVGVNGVAMPDVTYSGYGDPIKHVGYTVDQLLAMTAKGKGIYAENTQLGIFANTRVQKYYRLNPVNEVFDMFDMDNGTDFEIQTRLPNDTDKFFNQMPEPDNRSVIDKHNDDLKAGKVTLRTDYDL